MSKLTATAFSFTRNGWVNYEFPNYHGAVGIRFEPMHDGFAFADRKHAEKFSHAAPDAKIPKEARATPRAWAKVPQVFDAEHRRTFYTDHA